MSDTIAPDVADILAQLDAMDARGLPESDEFAALQTQSEVVAYMIHHARAEGLPEVEYIEALIRFTGMTAGEICEVAATLRPLGYTEVSEMLKRVAKHARRKGSRPGKIAGMGR